MSETKSKVRFWRRDAFRQLESCVAAQQHLSFYQKEGHRLKEYANTYYEALAEKDWHEVRISELVEVVDFFRENAKGLDGSFLVYVGELLLAAKGHGEARLFEGLVIDCVCGGRWSLSRPSDQVVDWLYSCNCCTLKSNVDIGGLPMSLPAPLSVRSARDRLHSRIEGVRDSVKGLNIDAIYTMLSYYTGTPQGYAHIGYLQTDEAISIFEDALDKIELDVSLVAQGVSVEEVLEAR